MIVTEYSHMYIMFVNNEIKVGELDCNSYNNVEMWNVVIDCDVTKINIIMHSYLCFICRINKKNS